MQATASLEELPINDVLTRAWADARLGVEGHRSRLGPWGRWRRRLDRLALGLGMRAAASVLDRRLVRHLDQGAGR